MRLAFADLIAPVSTGDFYAESFGERPLHVRGKAKKIADVMSWKDLSSLVNQAGIWSPSSLRLLLDHQPVAAAEYCFPGVTRDGRQGMLVDLEKVETWVRRGASIVLNDVETLTPGLAAVAEALETGPGGKVQGNLYCSRNEHQAFPSHFDTHDVYALHIAGEKRWHIYQRHFEAPINHPAFKSLDQAFHERHKGPISMTVTMRPGDLLYIPRGYYHDALAQSDHTIHVSYSVIPVIGLDLITAMFDRAVHDPLFRRSIPNPSCDSGSATDRYLAELCSRLTQLALEPEFLERFKAAMRTYRFKRSSIRLPVGRDG